MYLFSDDLPPISIDYLKFMTEIDQDKYPESDAIIIYKESYMNKKYSSYKINIEGHDILLDSRMAEVQRDSIVVKVLTDVGVMNYSSIKIMDYNSEGVKYKIRVKVIKPDMSVFTYGDEIIHISDSHGRRKERYTIQTGLIPNIAVNDIIHIEKISLFSGSSLGKMHQLTDYDRVLLSKIIVITSDKYNMKVLTFPGKIAQQSKRQLPSGDFEYIVEARDLPAVVYEPLSQPVDDLHYLACISYLSLGYFTVPTTWDALIDHYHKFSLTHRYIVVDELSEEAIKNNKSMIEDLMEKWAKEDKLIEQYIKEKFHDTKTITPNEIYQKLRKEFYVIENSNLGRLYPKTDDLLKSSIATNADLVFLFIKVCEYYKIKASFALMRDKRNGIWEEKYVSLDWFNRVLAVAYIDEKPQYFDFANDADIDGMQLPWHSQGVRVVLFQSPHSSIVTTPYQGNNNFSQKYKYSISDLNTIIASETYSGYFYDNKRIMIRNSTKKYWKEYFRREIGRKQVSLIEDFEINKSDNTSAEISYKIKTDIMSESQGKIFLCFKSPVIDEIMSDFSPPKRYYDIDFKMPKTYSITFEIAFNNSYQPMQIPQNFNYLDVAGFSISVSTILKDNKLLTTYVISCAKELFSYRDYDKIRNALHEAYSVLTRDVVFKKL